LQKVVRIKYFAQMLRATFLVVLDGGAPMISLEQLDKQIAANVAENANPDDFLDWFRENTRGVDRNRRDRLGDRLRQIEFALANLDYDNDEEAFWKELAWTSSPFAYSIDLFCVSKELRPSVTFVDAFSKSFSPSPSWGLVAACSALIVLPAIVEGLRPSGASSVSPAEAKVLVTGMSI
jgi:hypothetical protein